MAKNKKSVFGKMNLNSEEKVSEKSYLESILTESESKKTTTESNSKDDEKDEGDKKMIKSMQIFNKSYFDFRDIVETYKQKEDFRLTFADVFHIMIEREKEMLISKYGELKKAPKPKAGRS